MLSVKVSQIAFEIVINVMTRENFESSVIIEIFFFLMSQCKAMKLLHFYNSRLNFSLKPVVKKVEGYFLPIFLHYTPFYT